MINWNIIHLSAQGLGPKMALEIKTGSEYRA